MIALAPAEIVTREARPDDQAFVAATMVEQLQQHGHHADANPLTDRVLDSDRTRVVIATEGRRIVGWLAYAAVPRVRAVLFLYVRRSHRLRGVARALAEAAWGDRAGPWVHGGLRGGSTKALLQRYSAIQVSLDELL